MRIVTLVVVSMVALGTLLVSSNRTYGNQGRALFAARCLHDDGGGSQADRARREQALLLAREINAAQGRAIQQTKRYQPLQQLGKLPETPAGFVVRLYTDGEGYAFSIKDDRDACRYGIFSDQQGTLYQASPTLPLIAS